LLPSLRTTLEALGASSGVPDGIGASHYPGEPVRGQAADVSLTNIQAGLTAPVFDSNDTGVFVSASIQGLAIRGSPLLPDDRVRLPSQFWDIQAGGGYLHRVTEHSSWGIILTGGSASDRPFNSIHEATVSGLAFVRVAHSNEDALLYYVVSTTNGQVGHNIPIPGIAWEFKRDQLHGIIGFPFISLTYEPVKSIEWEFNYAALTEVETRLNYRITDTAKVFTGFTWTSQSWYRVGRTHEHLQLFLYEKRLEAGVKWQLGHSLDLQVLGGYAFDRYFTETFGLSLRGRNTIDIGPGPVVAAQFEFRF